MVDSLRRLGIDVEHDAAVGDDPGDGLRRTIPARAASLYVANSGTSLRFLTAHAGHRVGHVPPRRHPADAPAAGRRPARGAQRPGRRRAVRPRDRLPAGDDPGQRPRRRLRLRQGGRLQPVPQRALDGACPMLATTTTVEVEGTLVSQPYVAMTMAVMEAFGVTIENRKFRRFDVRPARYRGRDYAIEPDASAASYFFALAAVLGGTVTVEGLGGSSLQGDMAFVDVLEHMGCTVVREPGADDRHRRPPLRRRRRHERDLRHRDDPGRRRTLRRRRHADPQRGPHPAQGDRPDRRPWRPSCASSARTSRSTPTAWSSIPRPPTGSAERRSPPTTITAWPCPSPWPASAVPGVTILDPGCVAKTYPGFWDDLGALRAEELLKNVKTPVATTSRRDGC